MNLNATPRMLISQPVKKVKRFATLDFARGIAIFLMIALHTLSLVLNIPDLLAVIDNLAVINLVALIILPFYGGLAGFFLLVSAASNMVSMYRDLEKGRSIKSIVVKQIVGGVLLLVFAMLCEGLIGYHGAFGNFFKYLNDPSKYFEYNPLFNYEHWEDSLNYNWQVLLYRWNHFETIHTIAWCLILNGVTQGLLSLKKRWQNRRQMIISYALLAVAVVLLTQPVWELVKLIMPGYPFGLIPETGNALFTPLIGQDSWWRILLAPILTPLAAPMEPIFPYLAVSFLGSIIGIAITRPREEINKKFPRNMFLTGLAMFIVGVIGVVAVIIRIITVEDFDTAIMIYQFIPYHRHWTPDFKSYIPLFSWVWQFLSVNGFALMLIMILFRLVEYRGKSKAFSDRTRFIRRFGTVAFSNYNNQWLYYIMFYLMSLLIYATPYAKLYWAGTFLTIFLTLLLFHLLLLGWERIGYIGSLEWFIRTFTNNVIPARRERFDPSVKWWQKGMINVPGAFYEPEWLDLVDPEAEKEADPEIFQAEQRDSKLALTLAIVGMASIIFNIASIFGLFVALNARKLEGKNKRNTAALILSIIGCVLFAAFIIVLSIVKISSLGLPL
ncbi:MAG: heparan-alpha-glucosaminide N-acetyltransferase domain-containing protein [Candidatus Heimdallarchaeota archaeon]|nr:heparan-alpha-glucosaminide N-acetyltransferase domain-containing protein [Candidatus Heimdallarchaeota archaeon]